MAGKSDIKGYFNNVQKKLMNAAQRKLIEQVPAIVSALHDYVEDERIHGDFGSMTGNWVNSFGVALYRDGKCFAVANMKGEEDAPIRTTLIDYDEFREGTVRHDKSIQQSDFEVEKGSSSQYFADQEVLEWLSRSRSRSKGFSYRIVSVIEYKKDSARKVLLRLSDELESKGGNVWQFNLG